MRLNSCFVVALVCLASVAADAQHVAIQKYQELRWRSIGPFRAGRTRAVAGVPSQPNVFYIGAVNGGVWKSEDYGTTWQPIFDEQPTQSIGDIAVSPSDPNFVYVASGEGLQRPDLCVGDGIYRSNDAGKTWLHLGLRDGQQIPALAIDPGNPKRVFAAVLGHPYRANEERGIFLSEDAGETWKKVLFKDANTGGADVQLDPSNPRVVYATLWQSRLGPSEDNNQFSGPGGGLFKSVDGGQHWKQLKTGLPADLVQAHVAIAPSDSKRLYLVFSTTQPHQYATGKGIGFYRSDDAGESWYSATEDQRPKMKIGGGDLPIIKVDPHNPDRLYSTGIVLSASSDGAKTWESLKGAPGGDDYQNLWINPNNSQIMIVASDQGAVVSVNGGKTWSTWYNQPTAQIYHVSVTNEFPYRICGAQQESGSVCISSRGNNGAITHRDWHPVGAIEYGYVAQDPLNPHLFFGAGRNEVSKYDELSGQVQNITPIPLRGDKFRVTRTEPLIFSPVDPHTLYYAANFLFKTSDGGTNWVTMSQDLTREKPGLPANLGEMAALNGKGEKQRGAIYALAPSRKSLRTVWAGTDDGLIWLTRNDGKDWKNITPPELNSWSKVTQIDVSHFDDVSAYVSVSRFRLGDMRPYIYRTHDNGQNWKLVVSGLPESGAVNAVREDPVRKGMIYAATETSVYFSVDDGDNWQTLQQNLPHTSMRDLWIHKGDLIVATHGRGFWIMDSLASLRQISTSEMDQLFKPSVTFRLMQSTNTDTPLPRDEPMGENPPDGAIIDYFLREKAKGEVKLEIIDAAGQLVRRFSSQDKPEPSLEKLQKQMIPPYWQKPFRPLATLPGMHRFVWDLHYVSPTVVQHEYSAAAVPHATPRGPLGPVVAPGNFTVRLTANGKRHESALIVEKDPRVRASQKQLLQQLALSMRLAQMLSESSEAILTAHSVRKQIGDLVFARSTKNIPSLQSLEKKLALLLDGPKAPLPGSVTEAGLESINGDLNTLYGIAQRADAAPTKALLDAAAQLEPETKKALTHWKEIAEKDIPTINAELRDAKLLPLRLEIDENIDEGQQNEE